MKTRPVLLLIFICLSCLTVGKAQDYLSNDDLLNIKDQSEAKRFAWNKAFDDGVARKDFSALLPARQATESYLDAELTALRRLYATGDGRELITAVSNYLQIQKQYVKDVMLPAESLTPAKEDDIAQIIRKMNDFGGKEKIFLMDINTALSNSPEDARPEAQTAEPEDAGEAAPPTQEGTRTKVKAKKGKTKEKTEDSDEDDK